MKAWEEAANLIENRAPDSAKRGLRSGANRTWDTAKGGGLAP